jgi:transcriptional regulator with PAS, ATPase and Fis domain
MAAAMTDNEVLDAPDFRLPGESSPSDGEAPATLKMEEVEEWNIRRALKRASNNFGRAAELLGIHRDTLRSKIRKFDIVCEEG